jgi:Restriction endonuclease
VKYNRAQFDALHEKCVERRRSSADVGAALEDFVQFVFEAIPSVTLYQRDIKDEDGAQEIDLAFTHWPYMSNIPILDVSILVECKNEKKRTSASQVREFGGKLRTRSLPIGILVTAAGLSGSRGSAAHAAIRDELGQGCAIIVITRNELASLDNPSDLTTLLRDRVMELRTIRGYRSI